MTAFVDYALPARFAYWAGVIGLAMLIASLVRRLVRPVLWRETWQTDLIVAILQAFALGPIIWGLNYAFLRFEVGQLGWLFEHIFICFLVCSGIVILREYQRRIIASATPLSPPPEPEEEDDDNQVAGSLQRPAFLDRLESSLPGDVIRVSADNHYLQVFTCQGQGRVLMRFRDALEELRDIPGHRIHRSHWVAETALDQVRLDGRRYVAVLKCGEPLPVSQGYVDTLRQAGWIE